MAIISRKGSALVREIREKQSMHKSRQRFWELAGSNLAHRIHEASFSMHHTEFMKPHRYEVNPDMVERLGKAGLSFAAKVETGKRMEIVELPNHPCFIGAQFHPRVPRFSFFESITSSCRWEKEGKNYFPVLVQVSLLPLNKIICK